MDNMNDSADERDQLATPVTDYHSLLEMTQALAIAKNSASLPQVPMHGAEEMSPEAGDTAAESALRRGEIVYADPSEQRVRDYEEPVDEAASFQPGSNLRIRIYLGMS